MYSPYIPPPEQSKDGEPIHGASIGINRFLTNLHDWARTDTQPRFRMVLLNYLTLVRNCYDPNVNTTKVNLSRELDTLMTYVDAYLAHARLPARIKIPIIVYVPSYKKLPTQCRRELNAEMKRVCTMAPSVEDTLEQIVVGTKAGEHCQILCVTTGSEKLYPHEELATELLRLSKQSGFGYTYTDPYLCISHIQLDWHLARRLSNMKLCESYTGRVLTVDQFGDKLTGLKDAHVPFLSEVHRIFGDSTFVGPLVVRQKKKEMLEAAKKWAILPTAKVFQQMSAISGVPIHDIRHPSF